MLVFLRAAARSRKVVLCLNLDVFSMSHYDCYTSIAIRNKDWDGLSVQEK